MRTRVEEVSDKILAAGTGIIKRERVTRAFSVEFFLQPWVTLKKEVRLRLVRDLITIARNEEKKHEKGRTR